MALVQAGKTFTAADIKLTAGNLASMIRDHIQSAGDFSLQLQSWPDADLVQLGLTQPEINAIKGFYVGDLPTLQAPLAASTWLKQLIGMGV